MLNIDEQSMRNLTEQQQLIINANDRKIVVHAGPGSGKTYTLIRMIEKELLNTSEHQGVIACSFTREASNQLKDKLSSLCNPRESFIGTIDAFILKEIISPFKNRLLRVMNINKVVNDLNYQLPANNSIAYELTKTGIQDFNKIERLDYCKLWLDKLSKGTYEVSFPSYVWAAKMLTSMEEVSLYINSKYSAIFVDEAQDMNEFQHKFFEVLSKKCNFKMVFIGDSNQSIYQFRGARPNLFLNLKDKGFIEYRITYSVRCHKSILDYCNLLIDSKHKFEFHNDMRVKLNHPPLIENIVNLEDKFMVLCETNDTAKNVYKYLSENKIEAVLSDRLIITNKIFSDNYFELVEEIMRFYLNISNYNPKLTYSVIDYKDVLSNYKMIKYKSEREIVPLNDETLMQYTLRMFEMLDIELPKDVREELKVGFKDQLILNQYINFGDINRIMTIHASKGLESNHVFVVLGKCFNMNDEYKRKLFVAFSRAKHYLYVSKSNEAKGSQLYDQVLIDNFKILTKSDTVIN